MIVFFLIWMLLLNWLLFWIEIIVLDGRFRRLISMFIVSSISRSCLPILFLEQIVLIFTVAVVLFVRIDLSLLFTIYSPFSSQVNWLNVDLDFLFIIIYICEVISILFSHSLCLVKMVVNTFIAWFWIR